jgi:hypothetical protein
MRTAQLFALLAAALSCVLLAAPAYAQRDRVFVASYGSDSNPCTFGSPCKTFQNAVSVVAAGGEVTAIDSAGFGPVDIRKAVTITSPEGVEAGVAAAAGNDAIVVNAGSSDTVVLSGLTLEGAGSASVGISFVGGAKLEVFNCAIRNYAAAAILVEPSIATTVLVSNTAISDVSSLGSTAVYFSPFTGGSITAAFDNVTMNNNSVGIDAAAQSGPIEVQIANSHLDNNVQTGIFADGSSSSNSVNFILKNVTLNQTPTAINLAGYASVWLSKVTQTKVSGFNNNAAIDFESDTAAAFSDGTSHLMGALTGGGTLQTWSKQ